MAPMVQAFLPEVSAASPWIVRHLDASGPSGSAGIEAFVLTAILKAMGMARHHRSSPLALGVTKTSPPPCRGELGSGSTGDDDPCTPKLLTLPPRLPGRQTGVACTIHPLASSDETTCPASGEAVTTVPGEGRGGGLGDSERKRGWMWDSWVLGLRGGDSSWRSWRVEVGESAEGAVGAVGAVGESGRGV
ncbi:hypothetical protein LTR12_017641 [Friedmanniomyces endolithicus]|nr:hypothetical protein LTR12_017641 [Friedmanniomyces endolithicus]